MKKTPLRQTSFLWYYCYSTVFSGNIHMAGAGAEHLDRNLQCWGSGIIPDKDPDPALNFQSSGSGSRQK